MKLNELHLLTNPPGITSRFRNKVDASTEQPFQETNAQSDFSSYYPPRIIHTAATPQGSPGPQELSYGHKHLNLSSLALNSQPQLNVEKSQSKFEEHTSSSSIGRKLSTLTSLMPNLIPGTPFRLSPYSTIRRPSISKVDYPDRCYGSLVSPPIVVERSSQPSTATHSPPPFQLNGTLPNHNDTKPLSLGNSLSGVFYCSSLITRKYSSETEPATGSVPVEAPICNHSSEPAALANRNSSSGLPEFNQDSSDSRKSVRIEGKCEVNLTSPSRPLLSGVTTTTEVTKSKDSNGGLSATSGTGYLVSPSGPTIGSGLGSRGFQEPRQLFTVSVSTQ
uniref:Uncharacterized protein n=1 Tax=Tetranychus urticae TaxID=32264 RepID=T1JU85_TETUR